MKVLITGAQGFVGKNVVAHFKERKSDEVITFTRHNSTAELPDLLESVDWVFHLAGINRPVDQEEFQSGNVDLTEQLCQAIINSGRKIPVIYTSSIQAEQDNIYGQSKLAAEQALLTLSQQHNNPVYIFRLLNVFGKWARPNYNSAVATFCYNILNDLPITINNAEAVIRLVYIDDVVKAFLDLLDGNAGSDVYQTVEPEYQITVGELAKQITAFKNSRQNLISEQVGIGLTRALYSTYVSYFKPEQFSYTVPKYGDPRGTFVEMLKTKDAGQFSYFTAHPGVTRGGHYHHSKTEKFLVIKGQALFKFRHIETGEYYEITTEGEKPEIVETVTGWTHDITNTGDDEMVVMLWANEIFDRENPDTFAMPLTS
jgi:UDP-2-acetamido-2,6-beta-L-arabino-hexul-4-ose reductase